MIKIYIDAGHGGNDPGAVGNGLREKDLTLKIAKHIRDCLKGYNCKIKMSRTGDKTLSLAQRTNDANRWGADYFLSIHINAGGGTGYEDYIYNGVSNTSKSAKIRNIVHAEVTKVLTKYRVTNRGKKKANFHVLRESNMPAMLSETLFIDTNKDAKLLKDDKFLKDIGQAHAKGIVKAFRLNGGSGSTNTSKPVANPSKTVAQLAQEVIAGKWGNGEDRRKNLTQAGYDYSAVQAEVNRRLGVTTSIKSHTPRTFKVGQKVRIKSSAKKYSRSNVTIPAKYKNKSYTIQQVGKDDVLIKELYSWVKKKDTY